MNLTLSQRLAAVFGVLLLACSGASAWLQIRATADQEQELVQTLSHGLAAHIAGHTGLVKPAGDSGALGPVLDSAAVPALFDMLMKVNPGVEVYLLDTDGLIQGHAAPPDRLRRDRIDLEPVRRFAAGDRLPILGDDPRQAEGRKVFSAAPLTVDGRPAGWIYVVLLGEAHDQLAADVGGSTALRTLITSMALVAALGLVAGGVASRLVTRRLRTLTAEVRAAEAGGFEALAHHAAVPPDRAGARDEISLLGHAFGRMAQRIAEQWRELIRQDQQRRELIANVSHDLRTPLTSLHGYLETLLVKSETLGDADRRRYLQTAIAQSAKVGQLAQSLFELARLEYGAVRPEKERFLLTELVQDVFQKFELAAEARRLTLDADFPLGLPTVHADLGLIERVLTNLLDNAIRHTPEGGRIRVTLGHADERVTVDIADTGPGIPPPLRSSLFDRPSAVTRAGRDSRGGLGLVIVHRILRLHGSDIRLVDRPGQGAVFQFGLPVADH